MESPVDLLDEINTPFLDLPTCSTNDDDISPRQPSSVKKFEIQGSDEFKKNVRLAIGELEKINPKFLKFAKEHISIIKERPVSGMHVSLKKPRLDLSSASCNEELITWCASVLYHEAWHVWLYRQGKPYSGKNAEHLCNLHQIEALKALNADEETIEHLKSIISSGDHSDLDGDGDYDIDDYNLRDW